MAIKFSEKPTVVTIDDGDTILVVKATGEVRRITKADLEALLAALPAVTSADNGKVLGVVGGAWAAVDAPVAEAAALGGIALSATWSGNGPYTQTVLIAGATVNSMISLQPTTAQIDQLRTDGVTMLRVDNDGGVFTATAIGAAPTTEMTIQCMVTETEATA